MGHDDDGLGDQINMIFKGCTVVNGRGRAVTATGMNTEMGKIAGLLNNSDQQKHHYKTLESIRQTY